MDELDIVKLKKAFKDLKTGCKGTVVLKYSDNDFEVEFFDDNGDSIDVYTISKDYLELVQKFERWIEILLLDFYVQVWNIN